MSIVDHRSDEGDPELSILANAFLWDRKHKTSSRQATLNLIYATINASMAALPLACLECGIVVYTILLLLVSLVSAYSSIMIVHMADEHSKVLNLKSAQSLDPQNDSFEETTSPIQDVQDLSWQAPSFADLTSETNSGFGEISNMTMSAAVIRSLQDLAGCDEAFGKRGFIVASIVQLLFSFSLMCISLGFFADTAYNTDLALSPAGSGSFLDSLGSGAMSVLDGRGIAVTLAALALLPLCLLKKSIRSFQWLSNAAVVLIVTATITAAVSVAARSPSQIGARDTTAWLLPRAQKMMLNDEMRDILSSVLVVIFSFAYSQKVFIVYICLRRRTPKKWTRTVVRASLSVLGLYLIFGVVGSIALQLQGIQITSFNFFSEEQIDIANNHHHHLIFCVARMVFASCLLLSIPMECLTVRTTLLRLLRRFSAEYYGHGCLCSWMRCCSPAPQSSEIGNDTKESTSLAPLLGEEGGLHAHDRYESKRDGTVTDAGAAVRLRGASSITSASTDCETRSESISVFVSTVPPFPYSPVPVISLPAGNPNPSGNGNGNGNLHSEPPFYHVVVPAQRGRSAVEPNPGKPGCCPGWISKSILLCSSFDEGQRVVLLTWCILFVVSLLCREWLYIAVAAGAFCTSMLVFIFPSMIYFRLFKRGLPSDHRSMALCTKLSDSWGLNLVPNRVYMAVLLAIGCTLLLSSVAVALVSLVENRRIVSRNS